MSRKPILTEDAKTSIAQMYGTPNDRKVKQDWTQEELAVWFCVSRRTIQRALIERGVIPPYKTRATETKIKITPDEVIRKVIPSPEYQKLNLELNDTLVDILSRLSTEDYIYVLQRVSANRWPKMPTSRRTA